MHFHSFGILGTIKQHTTGHVGLEMSQTAEYLHINKSTKCETIYMFNNTIYHHLHQLFNIPANIPRLRSKMSKITV